MQDAEKMKEAGAKSVAECYDFKALYDSMLKIFDSFLLEKSEEKQAKKLDIEVEKRLEIMRKLLVQNAGIDSLGFQEINCKYLKFLNENQVHNQVYDNTQQVTDEFVDILLGASKDDPNVHFIPSMTLKNVVEARLVFLDEVKQKKLQDEGTLEEISKQGGGSDLFDVKMESFSSSKNTLEGSTKIKLKVTQASQPQQDQDKPSSQGTQVALRKLKPEWLDKFFRRTFFDPCSKHPIRRNDLNKYCIDCDVSLCQYCLSLASHSGHRLLKIYRHVYKDVVPFDEIVRHIDITKIQPYRCNRQMVIALSPLPHTGTKTSNEAACLTCKRKLIEYDVYKYCSITCKVEAFMNKQSDSAPPFLLLDQTEQNSNEEASSKKTRKRKRTPHRAPLS